MTAFGPTLSFLFGLILGSFFNVVIHRLPRGESIVFPGSRCPSCEHAIRWYENIPVAGYLLLRGKCSACRASISPQYPLVELLTGLLAALLWYVEWRPFLAAAPTPWQWGEQIVQTLSLLVLIPVAIIDMRWYIIPDSITLGGLAVGILASAAPGGLTPPQAILGIAAGGGFLLLTGLLGEWVLRREDAMGGGDIKLMAFLGAVWGPIPAFLGIVLASFLGAAAGGVLLGLKALREDHRIPFGPYLAAGLWVAVLTGDRVLALYFRLTDKILTLMVGA